MEEVKGLTEDMDPGWSWGLFELQPGGSRRDVFMFCGLQLLYRSNFVRL